MGVLAQAFSSSSGGGGDDPFVELARMLAQQNVANPKEPEEEGKSVGGFLKNLVQEPVQFVQGLGDLGKAIMGDTVKLGTSLVPGGTSAGDHDYVTDDIAKNLVPETLNYVKENYLSGWKNLGEHLYEDPLFAAMDIGALGQVGGAARAFGAKRSLKRNPALGEELAPLGEIERRLTSHKQTKPEVGTEAAHATGLDELTRQYESMRSSVSPQAQRLLKTLPGAARNRADVKFRPDEIAHPLGGERYRLMGPGGDPEKMVNKFGRVPLPANPWKRTRLNILDRLITVPLESTVGTAAGRTLAEGMTALDPLTSSSDQLAGALMQKSDSYLRTLDVAHRYGIDRIERPVVQNLRLGRVVNKLFGEYGTTFYRKRDQAKYDIESIIKDNPAIAHIVNTQGKRAAEEFLEQGLADRLQHKTGRVFGRMSIEEIRDQFVTPAGRLQPQQVMSLERHLRRMQTEGAQNRFDQLGIGSVDADVGAIRVPSWTDIDSGGFAQQLRGRGFQQVNQRGNVFDLVTPDGEAMSVMALPEDGIKAVKAFQHILDDAPLQELEAVAERAFRRADQLEAEQAAKHPGQLDLEAPEAPGQRANVQGSIIAAGGQLLRRHDRVDSAAIRKSAEDLLAYVERERRAKQMYAEELSDSVTAKRQGDIGLDRQLDKLHADMRFFIHETFVQPSIDRKLIKDYQTVINRQLMPYKLELFDEAVRTEGYADAISALRQEAAAAEAMGDVGAGEAARRSAVVERFGRKWRYDLADTEELINHADLSFDFAEDLRGVGRQLPVYFPHINPDMAKPSDWTAKRGTWGMENMAGKGPYKKTSGLLYLDNKHFIKNPVEAYSRRASQVIRAVETFDFVERVAMAMARPLDRLGQIDEGNEMVFAPRGGKRLFQLQSELMDDAWTRYTDLMDPNGTENFSVANVALGGDEARQAFVDVMRKSYGDPEHMEIFQRAIVELNLDNPMLDMTDPGLQAILNNPHSGTQLYAIPKKAGEQLNRFASSNIGGKGARLFHDTVINGWRSMVLTFIPRWMVNNFLGNIVFAKLQGASLINAARHALDPEFRNFVRKATEGLNDRNKATLTGGLFTETTETALGSAEGTATGQAIMKVKRSPVGTGARVWAQRFRNFNSMIEEHFRASSYVTALERQVAERSLKTTAVSFKKSFDDMQELSKYGMDAETANRALDSVNYFFNDYSQLGPRERNIVRRFIMPFYGFYKHIVRLATTYPAVDPARAALITQWANTAQELETEMGMMPRWLQASVPLWDDDEGTPVFLNTRGANPFDILSDPLAAAIGTFNPLARGFLSYATGRRLDRDGQPQYDAPTIEEGGNIFQPFGSDEQLAYDEETEQWQPTVVRPGAVDMLAENIPFLDIGRDIYDAATGGLGTRYGTGEVRMDPDTGEPKTPKPIQLELMKLLGLSMTPYDLEEDQQYTEQDIAQAFMAMMRAQGIAPESPYGEDSVDLKPMVF